MGGEVVPFWQRGHNLLEWAILKFVFYLARHWNRIIALDIAPEGSKAMITGLQASQNARIQLRCRPFE
ncbi:hypothetical protein DMP06_00630 [Slackia equolifaciens]|uniref:Uncharacterized protein n=1 Tax=Slackia equolifaciens TaxID=498718 RepID=A0A3N0B4A6_9ACTN|nr:hypothetical protein DMP06_00630 [Slackia equolifaciens]